MLFRAKVEDLGRRLAYVRGEFEARLAAAHPNLAERLRLRLADVGALERFVAEVALDLGRYQPASDAALDTWRQLF